MKVSSRFLIIVFFVSFLFAAEAILKMPVSLWAFFCGPGDLTINVGGTGTYTIQGDGSTVGSFEVSSGGGSVASISPASVSNATEATFTISGLQAGTTTFVITWTAYNGEYKGQCTVTVTVSPGEGPSSPPPSGPSTGPTEEPRPPSTPKKPKDSWINYVPKIPGYETPGPLTPPEGGEGEQPRPMVTKGLMDWIRTFGRPEVTETPKTPSVTHVPGEEDCCCFKSIVFRNTTNLPVKFSLSGPSQPTEVGPGDTFTVSEYSASITLSFWYPDPERNWGFAGQRQFSCKDLREGPVRGFPGLEVVAIEKVSCPPEKCKEPPARVPPETPGTPPEEPMTPPEEPRTPTEEPRTPPEEPEIPPVVTTPPKKPPVPTRPEEPTPEYWEPTPEEEEECDCKFLNKEWIAYQTIAGAYVYIPPPRKDVKISLKGKIELKAQGSDQDILIVRSIKTVNGKKECIGTENVHAPDIVTYAWRIVLGEGSFKNKQKADNGESVIYLPPPDLAFGEHTVIIETVIDDAGGKGNDDPNKGRIEMRIKRKEKEPDYYYVDFRVIDFSPVRTPQEPPLELCDCKITTSWEEGSKIGHSMIKPDGSEVLCTDCTDIWVGNGTDSDDLVVTCKDPECGGDVNNFSMSDTLTHMWFADFGSYLDANTGEKVLYKAPSNAPPGPVPNEKITLETIDSGQQYGDKKPEKEERKITVIELDLAIHKPKVIDPAEPEIPEDIELSIGAQTFVNLDNDDQDTLYDTGNTDVTIAGEDEMVKLRLKLKPKELDRGVVRLEATSGAGNIKVWREDNKTTEYVLGSPLNVPADFSVVGDFLERALYVEGISAHTNQRETKLKMTYGGAEDCEDEVALTVIGIDEVKWEGKNNSRNDDKNLDADSNHPAGLLPDALRVFPDARMSAGAVEPNFRDMVDVKVTLSVKPIEPVNLYFDSFDVDDPTKDRIPVDDETQEEDNRGTVPARTGRFVGEAGGVLEKNFTEKKDKFEFQVSHQPGDNFRIVGNGDRDFLNDLENKEDTLGANNADKSRIVNRFVSGTPSDKEIRESNHYASNILTVWRFLHVEIDSMGQVTGNEVNGEITDMVPPNNATATHLQVNNNLDDGSPDLSDPAPQNGRFERGSLSIPGTPLVNAVDGNRDNSVRRAARFNIVPLPFNAIDNDWFQNSTMQGTVTSITHNGVNWVFNLNVTGTNSRSSIDWPDFIGGTISIAAGTAMAIINTSQANSTVEVNTLRIPYTLRDDDVIAGDIGSPDNAGMVTIYAAAYIVPLFDTGQDTPDTPFVLNSELADFAAHINAGKRTPKSTDHFWAVTVVGAYQTNRAIVPAWGSGDNDPDSERTARAVALIGEHGALFGTESIRDWIATPLPLGPGGVDPAGGVGRQVRAQEILNHEVGHLFGLDHPDGLVTANDPQGGVMAPSCCPPDNPAAGTRGASTFTEVSLSKIRSRLHPGN